jgi:hypothetical protein
MILAAAQIAVVLALGRRPEIEQADYVVGG